MNALMHDTNVFQLDFSGAYARLKDIVKKPRLRTIIIYHVSMVVTCILKERTYKLFALIN